MSSPEHLEARQLRAPEERRRAWIARAAPALWRGVSAVLLVNAPFWWLAQSTFMSRALINLDSVVAAAVLAVAPWPGLVLLLGSWALDGALGQSLTYHFTNPLEFIGSVRFASALDWRDWLDWGTMTLVAPFAATLVALRLLVWRRRACALVIAGCAATLATLDALNGSSLLRERDEWRWSINLAGSPAATTLTLRLRAAEAAAPLRPVAPGESLQALIDIPNWVAENPGGAILLVIVESLGAPIHPALRGWLDEQVSSSAFDLRVGDTPFRGSTTAAELRTLCGLTGAYSSLDAASGAHCLPQRVRAMGWQTSGLHGFSRRMFDRERWWPLIGMQHSFFVDAPLLATGPRCGRMFSGTCDSWLIARALDWLRPGARLAYVLTLNTHLPLQPTPIPDDLSAICRAAGTPSQACELVAALGALLRNAVAQAASAQPRPLLVLIGDHAPPFNARAARAAFDAQVVPAYVLSPRPPVPGTTAQR